MLEIGKINKLTVARETSSGYYLKDGDEFGEVFLPPKMALENISVGDEIEVFLYIDTKDMVVATCKHPVAVVGEYALLNCIEEQDFGAFFSWGIEKDLLVPGNEQKISIRKGDEAVVRICLEEGTDRVFGTTKFGQFLDHVEFDIKENEKVKLIPVDESDLGIRVIVNKKYLGIIYHSEVFSTVKIGVEIDGYVKKLREDGLVDAALQIQGIKNLDKSKIKIMEFLIKKGGISHLHDKSSPEEISDLLGMSKKTFKSAIGMLYRDKKIIISKDGIAIVKN
jgi:predicted RNA-binding protein (virulence factor B family)